ncbi:SCN2A [Symbiodinium pilosum]|uniref:SCN2A protein n=1 Tax=Symbiodinium pilosum TaxID=2952 RepID=A0A812V3X0_SYMPI|nr:SCN2A [Symbiodinium pilosum]
MLDCMLGSLLNVIWCVIMLIFVMYVFALFVQQLLASYLVEDGGRESPETVAEIYRFFGSVGMTVITLFQASTNGVDWRDPYLVLAISGPVLPAAFMCYVAFVFISVWNIITSTFVEKALKLAQPDIDLLVMEQQLQDYEDTQMLAQLFAHMLHTDEDGLQRVGLEEFRHLVENSEFRSYLQTRGIDIKNAETFFKMLVELHGEPTIDAITFANACVRMKGAATSIDLQTVMYTTHLMNKEQRRAFQFMYSRLKSIESMLREKPDEFDWPEGASFQSPKSQPNLSREWSRSSPLSPLSRGLEKLSAAEH